MASSYTTALRLEKQANGENSATWGTKVNTVFDLIEVAVAGYLAKSVAGSSDVTLTTANSSSDEARYAVLKLTGVLTGNIGLIVPAVNKLYLIWNATTGAFSVTAKVSGQTGVVIPQNAVQWVFCDGTDVRAGYSTLGLAYGGTGGTTAATARTSLGSTTVGDAVFIAASAAAARTALGSTTVGDAVFIATNTAAARTAIGAVIGTDVLAYNANVAFTNVTQGWTAGQQFTEATLTDAAPTAWNLQTQQNAKWTLGASRTLSNPTNMVAGRTGCLKIIQDGTGSRVITWGSAYLFAGGSEPALSTPAASIDLLSYYCDGTNMICSLLKAAG